VSSLDDARAHLAKARTFLEAAVQNNDAALYDPATSNAVLSGINSKDAICLKLTGKTGKTDNHEQAVKELGSTGPVGRTLAPTLGRLLKLKPKSQYQAATTSAADAAKAIGWAQKLLDVVTTR
jgi:hypothetical protein